MLHKCCSPHWVCVGVVLQAVESCKRFKHLVHLAIIVIVRKQLQKLMMDSPHRENLQVGKQKPTQKQFALVHMLAKKERRCKK